MLALIEVVKKPPSSGNPRQLLNALGQMGPAAKEAVPLLIERLGSQNLDVNLGAWSALSKIGPVAVPALLEALNKKETRSRAIQVIEQYGPGAKAAIPALTASAKDPRDADASWAIMALARMGPTAKEAVPELHAVARSSTHPAQRVAIEALGLIGAGAREAVPDLIAVAGNAKLAARGCAIQALGLIGPPAREAVPALTALLEEKAKVYMPAEPLGFYMEATPLRLLAGVALLQVDPANEKAMNFLLADLKEKMSNPYVEKRALAGMTRLGPSGKEAIPTLVNVLLRDGHTKNIRNAVQGLVSIGKPALPALNEQLEAILGRKPSSNEIKVVVNGVRQPAADERIRFLLATTLLQIDPQNEQALALFRAALSDEDRSTRQYALQNVLGMGPAGAALVPPLLAALKDPDSSDRSQIAQALGIVGAREKDVQSALKEALKDPDRGVRHEAARALQNAEPVAAGK